MLTRSQESHFILRTMPWGRRGGGGSERHTAQPRNLGHKYQQQAQECPGSEGRAGSARGLHPGSTASSVQPGRSCHGSEPSLLSSQVLPCPPQAPRSQQQSSSRLWANRSVKPQTCPCLAGPRLRSDWGTGVPLEGSHSPSLGLHSEGDLHLLFLGASINPSAHLARQAPAFFYLPDQTHITL